MEDDETDEEGDEVDDEVDDEAIGWLLYLLTRHSGVASQMH